MHNYPQHVGCFKPGLSTCVVRTKAVPWTNLVNPNIVPSAWLTCVAVQAPRVLLWLYKRRFMCKEHRTFQLHLPLSSRAASALFGGAQDTHDSTITQLSESCLRGSAIDLVLSQSPCSSCEHPFSPALAVGLSSVVLGPSQGLQTQLCPKSARLLETLVL